MAVPSVIMARLAVLFAFALGACAGQTQSEGEDRNNVFPADYKSELSLFFFRNPELGDVKDVLISEPALKPIGSVSRYVVCVRFKGTAGSPPAVTKDKLAIFFYGSVNQLIDAGRDQCAGAAFTLLATR
ncbi:MAG: hypothetical protein JO326_14910 [Acetobacteraceae bacterium]|nr:hypothetical protein [Acetobacteraceae bacterium]